MDNKIVSTFAPYYEVNDNAFITKIGNTTYEVSTHFNTQGKETVLEQFKDLLLELNLI
ncbi:MAG: transposon-encoded TnpW family protein [Finegoldia magna]|uniref:transposon-encoded TnpW family protein n=1 Tax=Bacillota TaxID=1239 RepID=UPI0015B3A65D|nr:transposon-encoded TnpW family protein [Clostridium cadaveris]NWK12130.1 transposon-encoded TnpW family protein [Clostridium cadaveris]